MRDAKFIGYPSGETYRDLKCQIPSPGGCKSRWTEVKISSRYHLFTNKINNKMLFIL